MTRLSATALLFVFFSVAIWAQEPDDAPVLIIRSDDLGMSHEKNMANLRLMESGVPVSYSIMMPTPWILETAEMVQAFPDLSLGIHLTLNSEWKNYKWGPVLGRSRVPSLVDERGHFFATRQAFLESPPNLEEVEAELRAQIERSQELGFDITFMDPHMFTSMSTPELKAITVKLADEYGFGLSGQIGEESVSGFYFAEPAAKLDSLIAAVDRFESGKTYLLVTHVGQGGPEMSGMTDSNADGLTSMSAHRGAELEAILSPRFHQAISERGIELKTYRELMRSQ